MCAAGRGRGQAYFRVSYASLLSGRTNCAFGFLCLTKPSLLALHGSIAPCPGVHAGAFLRFMGIILQYLSRCASRSFGSTPAGRANPPCAGRLPLLFRYIHAIFPSKSVLKSAYIEVFSTTPFTKKYVT